MNERDLAVPSTCANDPFGLDRSCPKKRIGHKPGRLHEGEGNSAVSNRGLPLRVPYTRADVLLPGIVGRELHQMLHARSYCDPGRCLVSRGQLRTRVDQHERVGAREGWLEGRCIGEVTDED